MILCSFHSIWYVNYVFCTKIRFVKTSSTIMKYKLWVVKLNPVFWCFNIFKLLGYSTQAIVSWLPFHLMISFMNWLSCLRIPVDTNTWHTAIWLFWIVSTGLSGFFFTKCLRCILYSFLLLNNFAFVIYGRFIQWELRSDGISISLCRLN